MFSLIGAWTNGWVNNQKAADLRRHHVYYDVTVMFISKIENRPGKGMIFHKRFMGL